MKKIYTMLFAALAVCAVSCQEGPIDPQSPETETPDVVAPEDGQTMTFTASFDETKVALDGLQPKWEAGDAITIYATPYKDDQGKYVRPKSVFTTQDAGSTASFTGEVGKNFNGPYYAVYGHQKSGEKNEDKNTNLWEGVIYHMLINSLQGVTDGCLCDRYAAPMLAVSSNSNLKFQNVAALLKFTVKADNITSVKLVADVPISGEGSLKLDADGKPLFDDYNSNEVTLKGNFENGKTYYIAISPTTIHSLKMYVNGEAYREVDSDISFARSSISNLDLIAYRDVTIYLQYPDWDGVNRHIDYMYGKGYMGNWKINNEGFASSEKVNINNVDYRKWVISRPYSEIGKSVKFQFTDYNYKSQYSDECQLEAEMWFGWTPNNWDNKPIKIEKQN